MDTGNPVATASKEFLRRAERQHLESECLRPLDLRPSAMEPCKRFSYRGRPLWLDPAGRLLFVEGLKCNAGVFTVETYESILAHYKGADDERGGEYGADRLSAARNAPLPAGAVSAHCPVEPKGALHSLVFDLAYFEKRVFDRLRLTLSVRLLRGGTAVPAETRDVSVSGLQLRVRTPLEVREGDRVRVDVSPATDRALEMPELDYRVVHIRRLLSDTLLALQCEENEPKDGLNVIAEQVASASEAAADEQLDTEDALLTARALLAERFYMRSTTILPFFVFEDRTGRPPLRIIFSNRVNQQSVQAFETSPGQYDFHSLVTPKRIKLLQRMAVRDSRADTLIAVFRRPHDQVPQVRADLECKNHKHWCRLLAEHADQPGFRVFKVVARLARRSVAMRLEDAVGPLAEQHDDLARKLLKEASTLSIVGALIDVTAQVRGWRLNAFIPDQRSREDSVECVEDQRPVPSPHLVPVHYIQENRSEPRFLGEMRVEVRTADRIFAGETRDISAHGLSIAVADPGIAVESGQTIAVTFPSLEADCSGLARIQRTFRDVPAEIVGGLSNGKHSLQLRIGDEPKGRRFASALSSYLAKWRSSLRMETSHALRAATSRLYSSIFVESASTLPVFIYREATAGWSFRLGLVPSPSPLTHFFEVADGEFDFGVLGDNGRLDRLMQQVSERGSGEVTLFLHKERRRDAPAFVLRSLDDSEIIDRAFRRSFVRQALEHEFRCVKIVVNRPDVPPQAEIGQAIDRLARLSPRKSERLKADFENLIAIGDVVDVTGLVEDTWT